MQSAKLIGRKGDPGTQFQAHLHEMPVDLVESSKQLRTDRNLGGQARLRNRDEHASRLTRPSIELSFNLR